MQHVAAVEQVEEEAELKVVEVVAEVEEGAEEEDQHQ